MQINNIGLAGEVRCVVTKNDGTIKIDTGYQKNLILNQGLNFFGGGHGTEINALCAIGSGNSIPTVTQSTLDSFIATASGVISATNYSYTDTGDGVYRMWEQKRYRFTGLANANISEVGLVSTGSTSSNYYLTTRALIKDELGHPISISVKTGETLDIYYKIYKVVDTRDKLFVVNILDGVGGSVPYNVVVRPAIVGHPKNGTTISVPINANRNGVVLSTQDLTAITSAPTGTSPSTITLSPYVTNSFKQQAVIFSELSVNDGLLRTLVSAQTNSFSLNFMFFQMRFGRVSDDAPLTKTANDTLSIPIEFSWGRYEGAL